jgi:hypothetical protein
MTDASHWLDSLPVDSSWDEVQKQFVLNKNKDVVIVEAVISVFMDDGKKSAFNVEE